MSGENAERLIVVSTQAAARMSRLLSSVEDSWGDETTPDYSSEALTARLDAAGHVRGGGFDRCEVCLEAVAALPKVIAQMVQEGQGNATR